MSHTNKEVLKIVIILFAFSKIHSRTLHQHPGIKEIKTDAGNFFMFKQTTRNPNVDDKSNDMYFKHSEIKARNPIDFLNHEAFRNSILRPSTLNNNKAVYQYRGRILPFGNYFSKIPTYNFYYEDVNYPKSVHLGGGNVRSVRTILEDIDILNHIRPMILNTDTWEDFVDDSTINNILPTMPVPFDRSADISENLYVKPSYKRQEDYTIPFYLGCFPKITYGNRSMDPFRLYSAYRNNMDIKIPYEKTNRTSRIKTI